MHCFITEKLLSGLVLFSWPVLAGVSSFSALCATAEEYNGREERAAQEPEAPFSGRPALLLSDLGEAVFCPGLRQRRRGMARKHRL